MPNNALERLINSLNGFYYRRINKLMKFIPIIGLVLLYALYSGQNNINTDDINLPIKERLVDSLKDIKNSFYFRDKIHGITTFVLIITIWTGYKYWLVNWRYINTKKSLLKRLVIIIILSIFLGTHIRVNSLLGKYTDWLLFLLYLYIVFAGSWFLAKNIDGIDLRSDLYCWGLRLLGAITFLIGFFLLMSSTFVLAFSNITLVFNNLWWILSICLILLGSFMEYRSFRRYPTIHVW